MRQIVCAAAPVAGLWLCPVVRAIGSCEVNLDGQWLNADLYAWQRMEADWRGMVGYTVGVGMRYLDWRPANELRPYDGLETRLAVRQSG